MIAEEHYAAGHLHAYAVDGLKPLQQLIVGQGGHGVQIGPPVRYTARRVQQIGRAVPRAAGAKATLARPEQVLRARKGEVPSAAPAHLRPAARAQRLHARLNGGNALSLGNQKTDQRLPWVLPEDAQAPAGAGCVRKKLILAGGLALDGLVVRIQVKVGAPAPLEVLRWAVEAEAVPAQRRHAHPVRSGQRGHDAALSFAHAEALAAACDQGGVKAGDGQVHGGASFFAGLARCDILYHETEDLGGS